MEALKKIISEQIGITDEQSLKAIEVMSAYIKERTPKVTHSQFDKILAGHSLEDSIKKDIDDFGNIIKDKADGLADDLRTAFENAFRDKKKN